MTPDKISALVEAFLAELPETVRATPQARAEAELSVERVIFLVDAKRRTGGLAGLNAAYREGRQAGEIRVSYAAWFEQLIEAEVRAAAHTFQRS